MPAVRTRRARAARKRQRRTAAVEHDLSPADRAGLRLVQREHVQRRGHRLAPPQGLDERAFLLRHAQLLAALG